MMYGTSTIFEVYVVEKIRSSVRYLIPDNGAGKVLFLHLYSSLHGPVEGSPDIWYISSRSGRLVFETKVEEGHQVSFPEQVSESARVAMWCRWSNQEE